MGTWASNEIKVYIDTLYETFVFKLNYKVRLLMKLQTVI